MSRRRFCLWRKAVRSFRVETRQDDITARGIANQAFFLVLVASPLPFFSRIYAVPPAIDGTNSTSSPSLNR
jgi:hypothetical protein